MASPHTGEVSISGTVTESQVLTAISTLADADGLGTLHYQWQRNTGSGFVNVGVDQATYTLGDADVGGVIRVVVSYTDGQGTVESETSPATSAIAGVNDPHTGGVSVSGTATEDQILTATSTLADVDGLGTLHYQWQHDVGSGYVNIVAALDQSTYTLGDSDVGGIVRVVVSYTDGQGFAESATSSSSSTIANVNDAPTGAVTVTGTLRENQVLTADSSTLADADGVGTLHYQWQRDSGGGFVNVGVDQATYTLGDADVGAIVRVVVSYTDGQGTAEAATSSTTSAIAGVNDPHTGGVSISGTSTENQVLTAVSTLADVDGLGALHYQWQRDIGSGFVNVGLDQATYTLGDADVGGLIRVVASYTDSQGFAESATSAATAAISGINDPHTGGASISGSAIEDQVLTAISTLADADGVGTLHYQWQRDTGGGYVNVGLDQSTYTLGDADIGGVVRVVASYTDGQGFAESATSAGTAAIAVANDAHTGGVTITGSATENQVLTAVSTLADSDGLGPLHYQWQRNTGSGFVNVGVNQATYTLGDTDVSGLIRVVVSYTDGQGFLESATSAASSVIAGVNDPHTGGVSISGTATEDQLLTATSTLADVDGLGTLHYQWQRDTGSGYVNVGLDQATYRLGDADVGGTVRVVVSYTDGQGFSETATSAGTPAIANVNDAPVNTIPASRNIAANTDVAISGLGVDDVDATFLTTTLHVEHGTLSVGTVGGVTVVGSGSATVKLTGTVAEIDAALGAANNVLYHSAFDFSGIEHLTMTSNDGALSDTDVLNLSVFEQIPARTFNGITRPAITLDSSGHIILDAPALEAASLYGTKFLYFGLPASTPFPPVAAPPGFDLV